MFIAERPGRRLVLGAPVVAALLAACGGGDDGDDGDGEGPFVQELTASAAREKPGGHPDGALVAAFSGRLLARVAAESDEANLVCSPLSAQVALGMLLNGARGETAAQLSAALGAEADELNEELNTLTQALEQVGADDASKDPASVELANSVWVQDQYDVADDFLTVLAQYYGAGAQALDFVQSEKAADAINAWVSDHTAGSIDDLMSPEQLGEDSRLVLVNALHLKAGWTEKLRSAGSVPFTPEGGAGADIDMLGADASFWYEDDLCEATTLTTTDSLSLALVRPRDGRTTADIVDAWEDGGLHTLLTGLDRSECRLTLPPFEFSSKFSLVEALRQLGVSDAFSADACDLTGINPDGDLVVSDVVQEATVAVDEKGMEASAATAVAIGATSAPAEPKKLVLDVPFLFVVIENESLTPLVLGVVGDPAGE